MEGNASIGRMDYEDMFKEITRKLYGEDTPDHRTSSVQNEFEASVSYKNDDNTGNGTDSCDDGNWIFEEEMFKGTDSRIAAYHPGKAAWRCEECGEIMNVMPREFADHFMENHSSRIVTDCRNRHSRVSYKDPQTDLTREEIILYLEKLRDKAERDGPKVPSRRTQETQTLPTPLSPVTPNFLLQELPSTSVPQHLQQNATTASSVMQPLNNAGKRYKCDHCNYGTDRRDLFTRHESIHKDDKPFQCEVCKKPFNRADHVKKHHERMHKEQLYDPSKIRVRGKDQDSSQTQQASVSNASTQQQPHINYQTDFSANKGYQLQPNAVASSSGTGTMSMYQTPAMPAPDIMQTTANNCNNTVRRVPNSGCNSKSHFKGSSKSTQDRRFTCMYCPWSGADNWCLKRHMQTHTKPFECPLCTYKAARAERRATHVLKVHNRRLCSKCSFITEDTAQYQMHLLQVHQQRVTNTSTSSTLTSQSAPPTNVRHQQPLHAVGGRPPPGPPVFPAPTQTIAPVIASSAMLEFANMLSRMIQQNEREMLLIGQNNRELLANSSRPSNLEEKENMEQPKKSRKSKRKSDIPKHVLWHQDGSVSKYIRMIPALGYRPNEEKTETVINTKYGIVGDLNNKK
ncbi:zinc finger protein 431 isoform X2 [Pseudomyrmex gracilis]|uniref:zinc finger protein 431 isoform X2 n=1 Tax=Pseudomyrmex gracilis TaxID=219809 RepID=UPI0009953041|nr:zinc finger protein 431 isoform X2 [Pseudomyrmex gracilis]